MQTLPFDAAVLDANQRRRNRCVVVARLAVAAVLAGAPPLHADPPSSRPRRAVEKKLVYKQNPRRALTVFYPDGWQAGDRRPALVILRCNIPAHREHFRKLGFVVVKPQLAPVNSGRLPQMTLEEIADSPKPRDQVADAKSAIRFLRAQAEELGIDPARIVSTGASGGGDLALQSTINKAFEDPQDNTEISARSNALVLFCPAFDGIDIWFVKTAALRERTNAEAPAFLPLLHRFVKNTTDEYATPRDHRRDLIQLAAKLGRDEWIAAAEVQRFQEVLELFNARDWQLLHPFEDALQMSATRLLSDAALPPTLIMLGDRDHLAKPQNAFIQSAKAAGKTFELTTYPGGGHSFMTQPAFEKATTLEMERFLRELEYVPVP